MKNLEGKILGLVAIVILFASCSPKIPLTNELRKKYGIKDQHLSSLQFYNSAPIQLYRVSSDGANKIVDGELVITSDREEDRVLIPEGTPGLYEKSVGTNKIAVSFEVGDGRFLIFGPQGKAGRYLLQAEEWIKQNGKLTYAGQTYYASPASANAYLLLKQKKLTRYKKSERIAKGRKL